MFNKLLGVQDLFTNVGKNLIEIVESEKSPANLKLEVDSEDLPNTNKDSSNASCCRI